MNKSKTNLKRRQREIKARLDPSWQPQRDVPVLEGGNIHYEMSGRVKAIDCGGLGMLQTVVDRMGLKEAIDDELELLKRHLPYHESDHVLSLAYNILTGGQCLRDLELRRNDVGYLDALGARRIPDPTTAGDFLRRFEADDVEALMRAVNRARASVWQTQSKSFRRRAVIDVDGTIVPTHGLCKERMNISYDGRWGFVPLVVSLANTQEVLYIVNRPANRPSHDGAALWMDRAIDLVREKGGFKGVRLRGDTDFSLTVNFDKWTDADVEFVFGMAAHPSFVRRAKREIGDDAWKPFTRKTRKSTTQRRRPEKVKDRLIVERGYRTLKLEREHIAELDYRPRKAKKTYRLIVLKKTIRVTRGQLELDDEVRYFFYVTNMPRRRMPAEAVVREANARCDQENIIEQLKNGVSATRLPAREFDANWAYMVIGALAWNLKAWSALLLPRRLGARSLLRMEFRRFLNEVVRIPAQILNTGRRLGFRFLAVTRWNRLLLEGTVRLKRWQFA